MIYKLGIKEPRFGTLKNLKPIHKDNPFMQIDNNKCILCARCVRFICATLTVANRR